MTYTDSFFDEEEFDEESPLGVEPNQDSHRRRLVLLAFDLSGSMRVSRDGVRPVDALNAQIENWLPEIHRRAADSLLHVEFAVLTFGDGVVRLHTGDRSGTITGAEPWMAADNGAFVAAAHLRLDRFEAYGTTPMISVLRTAVALGDARAQVLAEAGITTGQIRLILFTDGSPNDENLPWDTWQKLVDELDRRRADRRNQIFTFGVPGSDARRLRELSGPDGYFALAGFDFVKLLELITIASSDEDPYESLRSVFGDGSEPGR